MNVLPFDRRHVGLIVAFALDGPAAGQCAPTGGQRREQYCDPRSRGTAAFTLVELLVVIGLIALLSAVVANGLQGRDGPKLASAQAALASQIQGARNMALSANAPARLLVENQNTSGGSFGPTARRRAVIAVKKSDASANTTWEVVGAPVLLPDGTAVLVDDGKTPRTTTGSSTAAPASMSGAAADFKAPAGYKSCEWYYFEFTPAGTCEANAGAIMVIGPVSPPAAGGTTPSARKSDENLRALLLRRSGLATAFDNTAHINEAWDNL